MVRTRTTLAALAFGLAFAGAPLQHADAAAAPRYTVDLIGEGLRFAYGLALNEQGQVAGLYDDPASPSLVFEAFVWDRRAGLLGLGTLGGTRSQAYDINDQGQIVGTYEWGDGRSQAFIYDRGGMRALDTPGAVNSWANGINARGQVTGTVELAGGRLRPFVHDGSTMQLINGPECCYRATAINDHGDIVGYSARPTPSIVQTEAFVYLSGQLTDLGTLPDGALSWTNDINSQGQVVGTSDDGSGEFFGFIIDDPKQLSLRQIYSPDVYVSIRNAMGINEHGDVVGQSYNRDEGGDSAYLLSDGKVVDLQGLLGPTAGAQWRLKNAYDINDRGQILVDAYDLSTGDDHTLLLTPVPEPETVALMVAGLLLLALKARRRAG